MYKKVLTAIFICAAAYGCAPKPSTEKTSVAQDTAIRVVSEPVHFDTVSFNEEVLYHSPFSAETLLSLKKVRWFEDALYHFHHPMATGDEPDPADREFESRRDSSAFELANRFMRMHELVIEKGDAMDMLQWAVAVDAALDTFRVKVPELPCDSTLNEIGRIMQEYTSWTQMEMNFMSYVYATIEYYHVLDAYRRWLNDLPTKYQPLAKKEYEAWWRFNEARYAFWRDVSYNQEWYSMKPMEYDEYYSCLAKNRLAELAIERGIIMDGNAYKQLGGTVTTKQWEDWMSENSVTVDLDFFEPESVPDDSIVENRKQALRVAFSHWLSSRQAIAKALPKNQGKSYDNLTVDMHSRMIETLDWLVPLDKAFFN